MDENRRDLGEKKRVLGEETGIWGHIWDNLDI